MTLRMRRGWLLGLTLAIVLVAAACGGDDDAGGGDTGGATNLSGSIVIDGSSTVAPITEAIAEEFRKEQSGVQVTVGTSGTGGGFTKFCAGETDIQDASRAISDEEKAACETKGIKYQEFRVGLDGLAVVSSAQNQFVDTLNFDQMAEIWKEGGAKTWNQVDSKLPQRGAGHLRPRHRVRHLRLLHRGGPGRPRRGRAQAAQRLHRLLRRQHARPGHRGRGQLLGLLRLRLLPEQQGRPEGHQGRQGGHHGHRAHRRDDRVGRVPPLPAPVHLRQGRLAQEARGRPVREVLPGADAADHRRRRLRGRPLGGLHPGPGQAPALPHELSRRLERRPPTELVTRRRPHAGG